MQLVPAECLKTDCSLPVTTKLLYRGCGVLLRFTCSIGHNYTWSSSAEHLNAAGNSVHGSNLLLAAACLLSGNSFTKLKRMFKFMGLKLFSDHMYYRYFT